jgi:glucosyl-dolichyl phosphate glucuronosyltransferase
MSINPDNDGTVDISVAFATFRRPDVLARTLAAFTRVRAHSCAWDLVVVDNANDRESQEILREHEPQLPLRWIVEEHTGKNRALNAALPLLRGDLYVFTDDDVLPDPEWLEALHAASRRWPEYAIFGGRIVPDRGIPFDTADPLIRSAYVISDDYPSDTAMDPARVWGPNMAIRAATFRKDAKAFDVSVGPAGENYAMGGEMELLLRLAAAGNRAMFVAGASVTHQIRPAQLSTTWLRGRCYRAGRGEAWFHPAAGSGIWFGVPRYLLRSAVTTWMRRNFALLSGNRKLQLALSLEHAFIVGQIAQYRANTQR